MPPSRHIVWRWLLLLLLFTLILAQDADVDLQTCFNALQDADTNGDGMIDEEEHLTFLQIFGPNDYWKQLKERPLELKAKFNAVACMCVQRGGPVTCCLGDSAGIDIRWIQDGTSFERDYLETVCILTQQAIDVVERERFETSREEEPISVWLRTSYQVTIVQGNPQTQDEMLEDLGTAMNQLVEAVLQEEVGDIRYLRRRIQEVEYLPTRLESTPTTCQTNMPPQNTCAQIDTTTYVVGPPDKLNQAELETVLTDAIASGQLQELVDEVNPDSYLRIMDQVPDEEATVTTPPRADPPPTQEPVNEEPSTTSLHDNGHDWSTGAIAGLVLAGAGVIVLAAGLSYGRRRVLNKREEESKEQMYASQQGPLINMELLNNDLEHDLDDLEKGNGGGGIVEGSEMPSDSLRRMSYKMDQVGLEKFQDDSLPTPPPPDDSNLIILPFQGKRPLSTKEPSEGDLGASNNIHLDSLNSSTAFTMSDRKVSSGSIGAKTPVNYNLAMGLVEESSDDSSYTSSSSSSSDSDESSDDDVSHLSSSSSGSSEYDQYGVMKARAYEARLAEARSSIKGRALEEIVVTQDAPAEPNNAGIIAGATVGAAALGGAAAYAATRNTEETKEVIDGTEQGEVRGIKASQLPLVESHTVADKSHHGGEAQSLEVQSNAAIISEPSTGAIVGVTAGAIGALAFGGAAVVAATRRNDSDDEEVGSRSSPQDLDSPPPQMQSKSGFNDGQAVAMAGIAAVEGGSFATIQDPVAVGEELRLVKDVSISYASSVTISVEGQAVVDEDSQTIEDPIAVGEESLMMENESSVSSYSSGNIIAAVSPLSAPHSHVSENSSPPMDSNSGYTPEDSYARIEDSVMLRPPPRPPSPSEKGPTVAVATAFDKGVVGVGAATAYLATRRHDEQVSESDGDSSSESDDEVTTDSESNEEASSDSMSDEETNTTGSQVVSSLVPGRSLPPGDERLRPPPSGSENPYYAAAAAMAIGGGAGAGAVYDFEESESSTSSYEASTTDEKQSGSEYDAGMECENVDTENELSKG